jgi:dTDP-4-amino-4,6-dideoxygalactose transaminase
MTDSIRTPAADARPIAVAQPLLPPAEAIVPYLRRIDASRIYSNVGPLVRELQDRLAAKLGLPSGGVGAVANATLGLTLALSAAEAKVGRFCLMPAWTFAASAHAVIAAGLKPYFLDVEPDTWALSPAAVLDAVNRLGPDAVGAVMPVMPFGARIDAAAWDVFHEQTRIPVVIDAAAAFDTVRPTLVPAVVSLHATKVLGAGEGGIVVSRNPALVVEVQRRSNFGFWGAREARVAATNAKMSEYSAAVGLASLDAWSENQARWLAVAQQYRKALAGLDFVTPMPGLGSHATSTVVIRLAANAGDTGAVALRLAAQGIATRHWWGRGLQVEAAFAGCDRDPLPVTEALGMQTLGLPCSIDLSRRDIGRVCAGLEKVIGMAARRGEPGALPAAVAF